MEHSEIVLAGLCVLSAAIHGLHTPVVVCRVQGGGVRGVRETSHAQSRTGPSSPDLGPTVPIRAQPFQDSLTLSNPSGSSFPFQPPKLPS